MIQSHVWKQAENLVNAIKEKFENSYYTLDTSGFDSIRVHVHLEKKNGDCLEFTETLHNNLGADWGEQATKEFLEQALRWWAWDEGEEK